ncbi:serine hydrolase domain-containing protein [Xanthobacter sediminis]
MSVPEFCTDTVKLFSERKASAKPPAPAETDPPEITMLLVPPPTRETRMLTRRSVLMGGLATVLMGGSGRAQPAGDPFQGLIDEACRRARARSDARLAVVLGVVGPQGKGRLLFAGGDGLTNPLGRPLALDAGTPFEIGSISKVFTSALHYRAHGPFQGTLGSWLGESASLSPAVAALTLENLATYRPGLPQDNQGGAYPPGTLANFKTLFGYLAGFQPPDPQGTCYAYSNLGWSLLAMAGTGIAGLSAPAFADRYDARLKAFCAGFGAADTRWFRPTMKPRLPIGYTKAWQPLPVRAPYQPVSPPQVGSGGIVSTGADMLAYLRLNMGLLAGGLSDPALAYQQGADVSSPACSGPGAPHTAYGWFRANVAAAEGPTVVLNKNGGVRGFTSWMGFAAWQGTGKPSPHGVFALANGPVATPLGQRAMRMLLGAA